MKKIFFLVLIFMTSCQPNPRAIQLNVDSCSECRMLITDSRFGAEIVTDKGKVYPFDSTECLLSFLKAHHALRIHSLLVQTYDTKELVNVRDAIFVKGTNVDSPMGANLIALRTAGGASVKGERVHWEDLLQENS